MARTPDFADTDRAIATGAAAPERRPFSRLAIAAPKSAGERTVVMPAASSAATIFRACPGCTRSSRVEVVNSTGGYVRVAEMFW